MKPKFAKTGIQESSVSEDDINKFLLMLAPIAPILGSMLIGKIKNQLYKWVDKKYPTGSKVKTALKREGEDKEEEHYVPSTGMFNRNLTVQQKIDKLNPARARQKAKIWHKTFSHHNPDTGETEEDESWLKPANPLLEKKFIRLKDMLTEAPTRGQLFAGNLKIDGQKVPVEVELLGANDKTKTYTAKLIHFDKKWASRMPKDGILNIPARIFRSPGGGWYRIKTPKAF
jgi:hypothetical protein